MDIYIQYNELDEKISKLNADLKVLIEQKEECQLLIIQDIDANEVKTIKKYGFNWTKRVWKHWPKVIDAMKLVDWMIVNKNKHLVSVNHATLCTFIEESQIVPDGVDVREKVVLQRKKV